MQKLLFFMFFVIGFMSCNTCDECEPFAEEPYVKLRFYKAKDSTSNVVIIDSINHRWAGNFSYYQDTVNTYILPLNMQETESKFVITYRDASTLDNYLTNTLQVKYDIEYLKKTDNNLIIQSFITETSSDFMTNNLLCKDDSINTRCLSNDAIYQVYR